MATSYVDQIMELEAQKQALLTKAKTELLNAAEKAIADLNNLGFDFKLVEGSGGEKRTNTGSKTGTRKGGIADQVLATVKEAADGLSRSGVLAALGAMEDKAQTSVSNALSNLKKKGMLVAENGVYKAK